jgi:hypothetical protein
MDDGMDTLLSGAPAARGLEELRVHVSPRDCYSIGIAALRDGPSLMPPPESQMPSFTPLETLRLRRCIVWLTDIQAIMDAASLLAALELDRVHLPSGAGTSQRQLSLGNLGGW